MALEAITTTRPGMNRHGPLFVLTVSSRDGHAPWASKTSASAHHCSIMGFCAPGRLAVPAALGRAPRVELQRRGLVHFHALLRADGTEGAGSDPPTWLTVGLLAAALRSVVDTTEVLGLDGEPRCWGNQFDVADLPRLEDGDRRIAAYLAKYATKTTDGSIAFARRFASHDEISRLQSSPHLRRLALTAWRLGLTRELRALCLRDHAHTLGYRGQLITKSRGCSTTFASLRGARVEFRSGQSHEDPIEGSFNYDGRGYDDPDAADLAELFFELEQDLRRQSKRAGGT